MTRMTCEQARTWMTERKSFRPSAVLRHLASCDACRKEAARLDGLLRRLAADAEIEPPVWLDRAVRAMLLEPAARPFSRPGMAMGLSAAGLLAMVFALATAFAEAGAAEQGPAVAVFLVTGYLLLSSAASLPLLLWARTFGPRGQEGAGR